LSSLTRTKKKYESRREKKKHDRVTGKRRGAGRFPAKVTKKNKMCQTVREGPCWGQEVGIKTKSKRLPE